MSFPFVSPAISNSNLQSIWKEQYGSASVNEKLAGIIPSGIYRGLTLSTSVSDNTVTVVPDPTYLDHLAVYQTASGFSLTFRDASDTTYSLALTDASLLSQTVVIAIFASYQIGATTTAQFIAYTLAEYQGLSASLRGELLVLGTVVNPAASNLIDASAITQDNRTVAVFNQALLAWRPVIQNGSFERSPAASTFTGLEVEAWTSTGNFQIDTSDVFSGTRDATFHAPSAGTFSDALVQTLGIGVTPGQDIFVSIQKKVLTAATGGSASIRVSFTGDDGGSLTFASSTFVISSTDAGYVQHTAYFQVPTGMYVWRDIEILMSSAVYGASGAKLRIGNVSALLAPTSTADQMASVDERARGLYVKSMVLSDPASLTYEDIAAGIAFSKSVPNTTEGQVSIGRIDGTVNNSPTVYMPGRLLGLGDGQQATSAQALLARVTSSVNVASGAVFTLMWESAPYGQTVGTYTVPVVRTYISNVGDYVQTTNARWDGTNWNKDVTGIPAYRIRTSSPENYGGDIGVGTLNIFSQAVVADSPWAEATWTSAAQGTTHNGLYPAVVNTADGNILLSAGANSAYISPIGGASSTGSVGFDFTTSAIKFQTSAKTWAHAVQVNGTDQISQIALYLNTAGTGTGTWEISQIYPVTGVVTNINSGTFTTSGLFVINTLVTALDPANGIIYVSIGSAQANDLYYGALASWSLG